RQSWLSDELAPVEFGVRPGGKQVVVAIADGSLQLRSRENGSVLRVLRGHTSAVASFVFSSDGERMASTGGDGQVIVWNLATGQKERILTEGGEPIRGLAFAPDGQTLATADQTA